MHVTTYFTRINVATLCCMLRSGQGCRPGGAEGWEQRLLGTGPGTQPGAGLVRGCGVRAACTGVCSKSGQPEVLERKTSSQGNRFQQVAFVLAQSEPWERLLLGHSSRTGSGETGSPGSPPRASGTQGRGWCSVGLPVAAEGPTASPACVAAALAINSPVRASTRRGQDCFPSAGELHR